MTDRPTPERIAEIRRRVVADGDGSDAHLSVADEDRRDLLAEVDALRGPDEALEQRVAALVEDPLDKRPRRPWKRGTVAAHGCRDRPTPRPHTDRPTPERIAEIRESLRTGHGFASRKEIQDLLWKDIQDLLAEVDALRAERDSAYVAAREQVIHDRDVTDPCRSCGGLGVKVYGSTATWRRGGVAGQMMTAAVCDACWGSGDANKKWTDLRALDREMNQAAVERDMARRDRDTAERERDEARAGHSFERERANEFLAASADARSERDRYREALEELADCGHPVVQTFVRAALLGMPADDAAAVGRAWAERGKGNAK